MESGRARNLPYSLSRWTDVPAAKWDWMRQQLAQGWMVAFDQQLSLPERWSLRPEDTLGLIWWTKDPTNLLKDAHLLEPYRNRIHVTVTGWEEVEKGAPKLFDAGQLLLSTAKRFGPENVTWRFSPVPVVDYVVGKFVVLLNYAEQAGLKEVFISFLQANDLVPETRSAEERIDLMNKMAAKADQYGVQLKLCNEDRTLAEPHVEHHANLRSGVCAPPEAFGIPGVETSPSEGCGCGYAIDPFTINETCTFGCKYCLDPSTPVLYTDMVWRPIGDAQVGDTLMAFDEHPTGVGRGARKIREAVIEAVWFSKKPSIRMVTDHSDVVTTAEHRWLNNRGVWRETRHLWSKGAQSKLKQIGHVADLPFTDDYRCGYLAGMTLGDGTFRYAEGQRNRRGKDLQPYWRVALKDESALGRLVAYLSTFGVEANIRPFDGGPHSITPMQKVEVRALGNLQKIHDVLANEQDTQEYRRGFLAGFYDAEGSLERSNLRMPQKDRLVLDRVSRYGAQLGFDLYVEPGLREVGSCRLRGGLRDRLRFLSTVRPAIARKSPDWLGSSLLVDDDPVRVKEKGPVRDVVDIQTSTGTFFAAGLATHNCYAADQNLAERKRNTTRLPLVK